MSRNVSVENGILTLTNGSFVTTVSAGLSNAAVVLSSGTMVSRDSADTMENKDMTAVSNNVIARGLWWGGGAGSISTFGAGAPQPGQVLTATSSVESAWADPRGVVFTEDGAIGIPPPKTQPVNADPLMKLYSHPVGGGRWMPAVASTPYDVMQNAIWNSSAAWIFPIGGGDENMATMRLNDLRSGRTIGRRLDTSTFLNSLRRIGFGTDGGGTIAGWRHGSMSWHRGKGENMGGWTFYARVGIASSTPSNLFVGMVATTEPLPAVDPSMITDIPFVGFGAGEVDSTWSAICSDGKGVTKEVTEMSTTSKSQDVIEFGMYCKPSDTSVYWIVRNCRLGTMVSGTFKDTLPPESIFMSPILQVSGESATEIDMLGVYIESPF
jgi:hypothetical protein